MPLVIIQRSSKVGDNLLYSLLGALPTIVAKHLSTPDHPPGQIEPTEVKIQCFGSIHDAGKHDLVVVVLVEKFQAYASTEQFRADSIAYDIEAILPLGVIGSTSVYYTDERSCSFSGKQAT